MMMMMIYMMFMILMTMTMVITAMLELGCHVRFARFHPCSLVPTTPHVSSIKRSLHSCTLQWQIWSKFFTGDNLQANHPTHANVHILNLLHQRYNLLPSWCYVCESHHKFPSEPSASDNCHSSAFSGRQELRLPAVRPTPPPSVTS